MVGSACWKAFQNEGYNNLIGKSSKELDLKNQKEVNKFIFNEKPDIVIDCAAKVGGILANSTFPYDFIADNLSIQINLISASHMNDVKKFIFLGSSCIYPKFSEQPIKEEYLMTGKLEETNQWYAIAKISGLKLIESLREQFKRDYLCLMPTNLYGNNDNFDPESSHVIPAMIYKFNHARKNNIDHVKLWGSGMPKREFLHVDDLANAIIFAVENDLTESIYNVGSGMECSIYEMARIIKEITGFNGNIVWDKSRPDGTPRKLLDISKLKKLGWKPKIELSKGLTETYNWFLNNFDNLRKINHKNLKT